MIKLKERVRAYFEGLEDEKFLQDKDKFLKLLDTLELKEKDFKPIIKVFDDNIKLIEERIAELNEYQIKSPANVERFFELKSGYNDILIKYTIERNNLYDYIRLYDLLVEKSKELI